MYHWGSDPCKVIEQSERQVTCPSCIRNNYSMQENGWKIFYCELGHDQNDGNRGQRDCRDFYHKGLARR